jgi:hypothetical protein
VVAGYCCIINLKSAVSLGVESIGKVGVFSGVVVDHLVWMATSQASLNNLLIVEGCL